MMYELLDTAEHPIVLVATLEDMPEGDHPAGCPCGTKSGKGLKVVLGGHAPTAVKAVGLITAVASLLADDDLADSDCREIRRQLARLLAVAS
ncbi:hypothetical protein [Dietzia cercidiphylli]|uniref:Uncharacterized protein n=1 Tax=Dietzia cercidiphylli TaxID=498199 RepID=A0ABP4VCY9_9ACTN|nr:hypothetical protein [Dietzia cercidiphylli]MBB1046428.1 hypothetical protein [Dietzia cercidiphylli]